MCCFARIRGSTVRSIAALTASTATNAVGLNPKGTIRRHESLHAHIQACAGPSISSLLP